ncbi:MAG: hypothetical protein ACLTZI_08945 [[Eubacterium] siraeum]
MFQAHINNNSDNDEFKQLIMDYGAASLSYCDTANYGRTDGKFGSDGSSYYYYCPEAYTSNHAVTVVGWDDSIPASAFNTALQVTVLGSSRTAGENIQEITDISGCHTMISR